MIFCASALLAVCLALLLASGDASYAFSAVAGNPKAILADGAVIGTTTRLASAPTAIVNQFLGVPFAAPPRRFEPPEDPQPWTGPYNATAYKPSCIQQFSNPASRELFNTGNPPESEDCLYLNVFAPSSKPSGNGRPVMFWIYGGNLQFGTGRLPDYDGSSFAANQDVIVVTFNYRTNVFGFATSPEIPLNKRNVGLYDQRKALAWVNANIHAFGGDPSRVTIFGESAGAWSVKQLFALPPHPPQFRAAIMESQGATISGTGSTEWTTLVNALGCNTTSTPLACVRAAPASTIRTAIESAALSFPPTFDNTTATQHVESRMRAANASSPSAAAAAARVPLLLGNNAAEGTIFANNLPSAPALLASIFGAANTSLARAARAAYPASLPDDLLRVRIIDDALFTCVSRDFAAAAAAAGYAAVWRYFFNASFPNTQPFLGAGPWHSSEVAEVFGTFPRDARTTAQQVGLGGYVQGAWAAFARGGSPDAAWGRVGDREGDVWVLGDVGEVVGGMGGTAVAAEAVDARCGVYEEVRAVVGL